MRHLAIVGTLLALGGTSALAESVVIPVGFATSPGNDGFGYLQGYDATFQQVYGADLLAGLPIGARIEGLAVRQEVNTPTWPPTAITSSRFDIYLGPSAFAPGSLSDSVAANEGPGTVLARSGPLTFAADSFPGGGSPNAFGPTIALTTPYTYTGGDLLLTLSYTAPSGSIPFDAERGLAGAEARQALGFDQATVGADSPEYALIVRFDFTPASVPEPSSLVMAALALGGVGAWCAARRPGKRSGAGGLARR
jgi:hypothetical protein